MTPAAPLRRWRLIEVVRGPLLTQSPLRIDERILNYLAGVQHLDERLEGLVEFVREGGDLVPSYQALVERVHASWRWTATGQPVPVIQLCGSEAADKRGIAAAACATAGLRLAAIGAHAVPNGASDLDGFVRLWRREAALTNCALLRVHSLESRRDAHGRHRHLSRLAVP